MWRKIDWVVAVFLVIIIIWVFGIEHRKSESIATVNEPDEVRLREWEKNQIAIIPDEVRLREWEKNQIAITSAAEVKQEQKQESQELQESVKGYDVFSAEEIHQAYNENQLAAESKYNGKLMAVMGKVDRVSREPFSKDAIIYLIVDDFNNVGCYTKVDPRISELRKGDSVILIGTETKAGILGGAVMKECFLPLEWWLTEHRKDSVGELYRALHDYPFP